MKTTWPFSEIFKPIAEDSFANAHAPQLIRSAFARQLESQLAGILSQCLYLEFTAHRMSFEVFSGSRKECYSEFVRSAKNTGLDTLLNDYPVGTKAITLLCRQAREYAELISAHLEEDRYVIATLLGSSSHLKLHGVSAGWSDPHHGGRTVVRLVFEDQRRIFYKPRSLAVDCVWAEGLKRVNRHLPLPLRGASAADLGQHGWAEAITKINRVTSRESHAFYWRCGALLCLAWLLDAVDLHRENIVICRADPVVVDAEGLLHPFGPNEERSLSRTLMMPHPKETFDVSYLGKSGSQIRKPTLYWKQLSTDNVAMVVGSKRIHAATHLPMVGKSLIPPRSAITRIRDGFAAVARIANKDRSAIKDWRLTLAGTQRRRIYRSTPFYTELLFHAAHPVNMDSLENWQQKIVGWLDHHPDKAIVEAERRQLARWDIPVFATEQHSVPDLPWEELSKCQRELDSLVANK